MGHHWLLKHLHLNSYLSLGTKKKVLSSTVGISFGVCWWRKGIDWATWFMVEAVDPTRVGGKSDGMLSSQPNFDYVLASHMLCNVQPHSFPHLLQFYQIFFKLTSGSDSLQCTFHIERVEELGREMWVSLIPSLCNSFFFFSP